jgi:hypothetical protein
MASISNDTYDEVWALLYLHDWDPPKEGQVHKWEPGKNVFPEIHEVYSSMVKANLALLKMRNPNRYWVRRARWCDADARRIEAPSAPQPEASDKDGLRVDESVLVPICGRMGADVSGYESGEVAALDGPRVIVRVCGEDFSFANNEVFRRARAAMEKSDEP